MRARVFAFSRLDPLRAPAFPRPAPPPARRHFQRGNEVGPRTTGPPPPSSVYIPPAGESGSIWLVSALAGNYQTIRILNYFDISSVESCHFPENKVGLWALGPPHRRKGKQTGGRGGGGERRWEESEACESARRWRVPAGSGVQQRRERLGSGLAAP